MTMNGISGAGAQMGQLGMPQAADAHSRSIQRQIAEAQRQLQELSSDRDMAPEEKRKKRQEIQRRISDLNMQLRQYQLEQRRAAQNRPEKQQTKSSTADGTLAGADMRNSPAGDGSADKELPPQEVRADQPYAVTISREGLEKLRQNAAPNTMGMEKADQYREILSKAQIDVAGATEADFHHRYTKRNTETGSDDMKEEDFEKNLRSVYADMYDEIRRGYADGTREIYIADGTAEFGYRRVTEEEEIAALDAAFDFHAVYTAGYFRFVKEDKEALYVGMQRTRELWRAARENRTRAVEGQFEPGRKGCIQKTEAIKG